MGRRDAREARTLGLWTASWLAVLLLVGLLWVGDLAVQWPVLLVPAGWAMVALRPRRNHRRGARGWEQLPPAVRTDTVERPLVQNRPDRRRERD
jgi:Flp pilus assembly protein TadB